MANLKIPSKTLQDNFDLTDFQSDFLALDEQATQMKVILDTWEAFKNNGGIVNGEFKSPMVSITKNGKKQFSINIGNDSSNDCMSFHSYNAQEQWLKEFMRMYFDGTVSIYGRLNLEGHSISTNGFTKLPNGMIMQWGITETRHSSGTGSVTINYPVSFANASFFLTSNAYMLNNGENSLAISDINSSIHGVGLDRAFISTRCISDNTWSGKVGVCWMAIGY